MDYIDASRIHWQIKLACWLACFLLSGSGCSAEPEADLTLPPKFERLLSLHHPLGKPQSGDWLISHPELGQTYHQYLHSHPMQADERRRVIYVQPLGKFDEAQRKIVDLTAEYMGVYFQLPVKVREGISLDRIPKKARRKSRASSSEQILSTYVLDSVLKPRLPKDAVALIALTASDLWPSEGWNYVFGQASLVDRVGVWSFNRNGDPTGGEEAFRLCLLRTLKTATHETGHIFSMSHCILYECNMCGSNNLSEADRHPLELCPHCLAKLVQATGADPEKRFEKLIEFYKANGFKDDQAFCEKSLEALTEKKP